jgi:hypothetical protein
MNTPHPDRPDSPPGKQIVYIREIAAESLPDEIRVQIGGAGSVWGVHTPAGECLALAPDRHLAFVVARQNELEPVSAH